MLTAQLAAKVVYERNNPQVKFVFRVYDGRISLFTFRGGLGGKWSWMNQEGVNQAAKVGRRPACQQAKHAKLYSDLPQA